MMKYKQNNNYDSITFTNIRITVWFTMVKFKLCTRMSSYFSLCEFTSSGYIFWQKYYLSVEKSIINSRSDSVKTNINIFTIFILHKMLHHHNFSKTFLCGLPPRDGAIAVLLLSLIWLWTIRNSITFMIPIAE